MLKRSNGRKDYAYSAKKDKFGCNTHKCNKFVHNMAKAGRG